MEATTLLLLVAAAFLAAFIDAIVGGGGVITLPALLAAGLPPHLALGTNKLAATGASTSATLTYVLHRVVHGRAVLVLVPLSLLGSALGVLAVLQVPGTLVIGLVVVVIVLMTAHVLLRPRFGAGLAEAGRGRRLWALLPLALGVGFYDGFLGPGTGSMLLFGMVALGGFGFLAAAANGRVLNLASNAAALVVFAWMGQVAWEVGLPMLAATLAGGTVGSRFGVRHGAKVVRPLFVVMSVALAARLLWDLLG